MLVLNPKPHTLYRLLQPLGYVHPSLEEAKKQEYIVRDVTIAHDQIIYVIAIHDIVIEPNDYSDRERISNSKIIEFISNVKNGYVLFAKPNFPYWFAEVEK